MRKQLMYLKVHVNDFINLNLRKFSQNLFIFIYTHLKCGVARLLVCFPKHIHALSLTANN